MRRLDRVRLLRRCFWAQASEASRLLMRAARKDGLHAGRKVIGRAVRRRRS